MNELNIEVNPQEHEFCLATGKGWVKPIGLLIEVGNFKFSAVPHEDEIIVSEVESGARVFSRPIPELIQTKEATLFYLETVIAAQIATTIKKFGVAELEEQVKEAQKNAIELLGEKPETHKVTIGEGGE